MTRQFFQACFSIKRDQIGDPLPTVPIVSCSMYAEIVNKVVVSRYRHFYISQRDSGARIPKRVKVGAEQVAVRAKQEMRFDHQTAFSVPELFVVVKSLQKCRLPRSQGWVTQHFCAALLNEKLLKVLFIFRAYQKIQIE